MLVRSQVKYIQSLGHKKFRDEEGVFVAEGPKLINELLGAANIRPVSVYACKEWLENNGELLHAITSPAIVEVKKEELERISALSTPNQVVGVFSKPIFPLPIYANAITLLLDNIQDPGNLGTIVRIADWFGIRQVVCSRESADLYNPKVVQSTMGSISRVQVLYEDLPTLVSSNPAIPVYAAALDGESPFGMTRIREGLIVIGNESKGIRAELLAKIRHHITIPGSGQAESLNAAVATGIILSHLVTLPT